MQVTIWGARGSIPAPIRPEAIREKIISAILGISEAAEGELREKLIAAILEDPNQIEAASDPGRFDSVYDKLQAKRRHAVENYLDSLSLLSTGTAGGNTPCIELWSGDDLFIIDAGSGIRELGQQLMAGPCGKGEGIVHLFFSHPHWDHIQGFPFFRPAFIPGNQIKLYSIHDLETALMRQQETLTFPVSLDYMQSTMTFNRIKPGEMLEFGDLRIRTIRNEHPGDAYSFRFEKGNKAFVYASDAAYPAGSDLHPHLNFFEGADVLIFDAQFMQRESDEKEDWGHSSSFVGVEMAQQAGVKNLVLFHYDPTYSDEELEQILDRTLKFQQNQYPNMTAVKVTVAQEGQCFDLTPDRITRVQQVPGSKAAILEPTGVFDEVAAAELREQLLVLTETGWPPQLIIDMSNVEMLQVAGLRALVRLRKDYQQHGTLVALAGPSINVQQLIELAGYLDFFAIFPSVREALRTLEARETLNLPGQILKSRYQVKEKIGEGRLGTVFRAVDLQQKKAVAVKILSPSFSEGAIEQFLRQARQIIDLVHPNIVDVHDCDEDRGIAFMVEEVLDSGTLRDVINEDPDQPLPYDIALSIARSTASALEYAHANGVIHGDLKPKNVLLSNEVKISDFGLGRLESGRSLINIEVPLSLVTARYLAPEQVLGHPIDARTDLYAFGVILYEMFTGRPPFNGTDQEVLEFHRSSEPVPPRQLNPDLSRSLEHLILKLLDKDPNKRYAQARQVGRILDSMSAAISGEVRRRSFAIEPRPSLAGREDVMARLTERWTETQRGQGQIVFISGAAGVGKTRVVQELISYLDEATVFLGNCQSMEGSPAFHPFVSALTAYLHNVPSEIATKKLGRLWQDVSNVAPEASDTVYDLLATVVRDQLAQPTSTSLAGPTSETMTYNPWLLIVDDLQWLDRSSMILLDYLARQCAHLPLMIVGLFQEDLLADNQSLVETINGLKQLDNCETFVLNRLAEGEVKKILAGLWTRSVPADLVSAIYNSTAGNALFVGEVARGLADEGIVSWRANKWYFGSVVEASLPKHINDAILRRVTSLSRETRTFLNQAAIFDPVVKFDDLHEMSDLSNWDALESLDIALDRQLLKEAPGERVLRFAHTKIQEVLYRGLSSLRRRLMHREAGEALERQYPAEPKEIPEALAYHFFQAGELEKGLIYSIQAAAQARAIYAHENALYWYTQALDAMDQLGLENLTQQQRFELLLAREQMLHHLGHRSAQLADLSTLQSLGQTLNEASKQATVHNRRAALAYATNNLDEAATEARAGLIAATQAGQAILVADSLLQTALIESQRGQFDAVRSHLSSVRNALKETGEQQPKITYLNGLGTLHRQLNEFTESERWSQQALELAGLSGYRYGQAIALSSLGETRRRKGDYNRSLSCQRQALVLNQFICNRPGEATCLNRLASLYQELGFYREAQDLVARAIVIHREIEDEAGLALDFQLSGTILATGNELETAHDYLKQALEICQRSGRQVQEGAIWLDLAMMLESMGELAETGQAYQAAHSIFSELGINDGVLEAEAGLARCLLAEGKAESARRAVEVLLALVDEPGRNRVFRYPVRLYLAAYRVLATAEIWDKAQAALQQGHDLLQNRANTIEDARLKASFLENVPENKELLAMLEQHKVRETAD